MKILLLLILGIVIYAIFGFTIARLAYGGEEPASKEQEIELQYWYVLTAFLWPVFFSLCCIITIKEFIEDFKKKENA